MIRSFGNLETEGIWKGEINAQRSLAFLLTARRRLRLINNIAHLNILRDNRVFEASISRNNNIETCSIKLDDDWRIFFIWEKGSALEVQIVDKT